jgi:hypothetical protein
MNDDEVITAVREQRDKVHSHTPVEQIISRGRVVRSRRRIPGVAGALTVAAAAALAVTVLGAPGHQHSSRVAGPGTAGKGADRAVREVAYQVAAAAAAGPTIRPGQWVYWQEKIAAIRQPGYSSEDLLPVWMTASPARAAYVSHGKLVFMRTPRGEGSSEFGGPPFIPAGNQRGAAEGFDVGAKVTYAGLGQLPRDPRALYRYLSALRYPSGEPGPPPRRAFVNIESLLSTYVMPPRLTAELFLALGDVPGVRVDRRAVDALGRPAIAFTISFWGGPWARLGILVSRHGYQLLGTEKLGLDHGIYETAILHRALVSGPGVLPQAGQQPGSGTG